MNEVANGKSHTSTPAVVGALLYVAAKERGAGQDGAMASADSQSAVGTALSADVAALGADDREILAEVDVALRNQSSDEVVIESTLAEVTRTIAALRGLSEPPPLAAARYEALRSEVLSELGVTSSKGASIWPPTSQTAVQRFGSWNEALKAAGLATSSTGRAKGQLRFDATAYDRTLRVFVADCEKRGVPATYKEYGAFAAERKGDVPSAAAVRKFYGSWNKALASAG